MDALVWRGEIDPSCQSLDFDNLCIVDNLNYYVYEKYPNVCGIPLWMKDELRKKSIYISAGIPITMFLAKPPSKAVRYCVYDPNMAVSSIFSDATFYDSLYDSPTRNGVRIESVRPFVEVSIDGELYLVDTLTKRILKSSWFKKKYNFKIISKYTISELDGENLKAYRNATKESMGLGQTLHFMLWTLDNDLPQFAEMKYEIEESKKYFPLEWEKYQEYEKEFELFKTDPLRLIKKKEQE